MSSVLSQGNGPAEPGAHEIDYFGQGGHKTSLTYGNILLCCKRIKSVEGQHHAATGHKIFLATGGPDPKLLLSFGPSLLLSSPFHTAPLTTGCSQRHLQAGFCFPESGGESQVQALEKVQREGMWNTVGFHSQFPGHSNNT